MCRAIKVSSTSTISYYLNKLEMSGLIKKSPNKNRALEIVGETFNLANYIKIPVVGKITAGEPILAIENTEEYFIASPSLFRGDGLFILTVSGESMINAGIYDGDKIVVKQQSSAENGEIVAALIDGFATVKRFYKEENRYRLQPENDTMDPIYTDSVEILGKVVGLIRNHI
jgi:repressor LexA